MEVCDTAAGVTVCQRQLVFKEEKLTAPKSVVGLTQPRGPFTEKIDAAALRALPDLERADLDEVAQLSLEELCDMIQLLADRLYALGLVGSGTVGVAFFDERTAPVEAMAWGELGQLYLERAPKSRRTWYWLLLHELLHLGAYPYSCTRNNALLAEVVTAFLTLAVGRNLLAQADQTWAGWQATPVFNYFETLALPGLYRVLAKAEPPTPFSRWVVRLHTLDVPRASQLTTDINRVLLPIQKKQLSRFAKVRKETYGSPQMCKGQYHAMCGHNRVDQLLAFLSNGLGILASGQQGFGNWARLLQPFDETLPDVAAQQTFLLEQSRLFFTEAATVI